MIKIAIDMMGTDLGIQPIIEALETFTKKYSDVKFILVGDKNQIKSCLKKYKINEKLYDFFHTTEVIKMTDGPLEMRRKKDSSMVRSAELLRDNKVDAFVSGGSTAVYLTVCHFIIGEMDGILRPGFMPFIPTIQKDKNVMMIDVGASSENDAEDLLNFALMATIYAEVILNLKNSRVGLLNIGEEASKGKEYHKKAYKLLQEHSKINFIGNIEARDVISNKVDIIVTDGFTGNMVLKAIEGMAKNLMNVLKKELNKNFVCKFKTFLLRKSFNKIKETFDYRNNASALMLGLKQIAVKTHGNSDKKSWISTFEMAKTAVINDFVIKIKEIIKKQ